eukprot:1356094-Pleurochrysis_carterae.AAC.2
MCYWATCKHRPYFKQIDKVERDSILLYDAEFTKNNHPRALTKKTIIKVIGEQEGAGDKLAFSMIPSTWRAADLSKRQTKKSHTR